VQVRSDCVIYDTIDLTLVSVRRIILSRRCSIDDILQESSSLSPPACVDKKNATVPKTAK
jgi:hypothetical protein